MDDDESREKRIKQLRIRFIVGGVALLVVVVGWWLTHSPDSPVNNPARSAGPAPAARWTFILDRYRSARDLPQNRLGAAKLLFRKLAEPLRFRRRV